MSTLPNLPSLHRLTPGALHDTSSYGYEVIAQTATTSECIQVVGWVDCWCPDAAQFILLEAGQDLTVQNCPELLTAIAKCHLGTKICLVCRPSTLSDRGLMGFLQEKGLRVIADDVRTADLRMLIDMGVVGIRVCSSSAADAPARGISKRVQRLVNVAREFGLRSIASQAKSPAALTQFIAAGFDYVSQSGPGISPTRLLQIDIWRQGQNPGITRGAIRSPS